MKKLQRIKRFIKSLLIIALLGMLALVGYQNWYIFTQNKWEVKEYTRQTLFAVNTPEYREKCELKALIEDVFDVPHFYVEYKDLSPLIKGDAIEQINMVFVDKDLDGFDYASALAHELSHCKYQSNNECYTEFMAIKTLIESKYEYTQNLGKYWANRITNGYKDDGERDCGWYLIQEYKGEQ